MEIVLVKTALAVWFYVFLLINITNAKDNAEMDFSKERLRTETKGQESKKHNGPYYSFNSVWNDLRLKNKITKKSI